jgi:hypothetical protein
VSCPCSLYFLIPFVFSILFYSSLVLSIVESSLFLSLSVSCPCSLYCLYLPLVFSLSFCLDTFCLANKNSADLTGGAMTAEEMMVFVSWLCWLLALGFIGSWLLSSRLCLCLCLSSFVFHLSSFVFRLVLPFLLSSRVSCHVLSCLASRLVSCFLFCFALSLILI